MSVLTNAANWPIEPPLALIVLAALLYGIGLRRRSSRRGGSEARRRAAAFYGGLLVLYVALDSPVAAYDDSLFSVHMTQHVLLMTVAPPLIVLGRPWLPLWQPFPLRARRSVARQLAHGGWAAPLRWLGRVVARPIAAWLLASGTMVVWHVPWLYDETVRNALVHDLEHLLFFATSLLLWLQLIDSPPVRSRLDHFHRAVYATAAITVGWLLAIVLALAHTPLYGAYADVPNRPGGLSALGDQALAAGVLWVPGSIALLVSVCINFYIWLDPDRSRRARRLAGQH